MTSSPKDFVKQHASHESADQDCRNGPGNQNPAIKVNQRINHLSAQTNNNEQDKRANGKCEDDAFHTGVYDVIDNEVDHPGFWRLVVYRHLSLVSFLWGTLLCVFLFTAVLYALSTPHISSRGLTNFLVPGTAAFVLAWLSVSAFLLPLLCLNRKNAQIAQLAQNHRLIERTYGCCAGGRLWLTIVAMSALLPAPDTAIATRAMIVLLMSSAGVLAALADCCATFISLIDPNRKVTS